MKTIKYLSMLLMMVTLSVCMASCGDDSKEEEIEKIIEETGIIGTWYDTSGGSSITFTFSKDGSGYMSETTTTSTGHSQTTNLAFVYTYTAESHLLKLYVNGSDTVYFYTVDLTGNTLMLTRGNSVYILKKR